MWPRPTLSSHWPPPYAPIPFRSQNSYVAKSRSIGPKREGFTLTVRGGRERLDVLDGVDDRVPGDAVGVRLEERACLRRERGSSIQASGKRLDHAPVEVGVRRVVDDRAAVLALEVDRVDAAERLELGEDRVGPVRAGVELEAEPGGSGRGTRGREQSSEDRRARPRRRT